MLNYIIRRLFLIFPKLAGIMLLTFIIINAAPGDPISSRYGLNPEVSAEAQARLRSYYGLDKPLLERFGSWMASVGRLDFGRSFIDDRPVMEKIGDRLPATILLNICSLLVIYLLAIPIGVRAAISPGSLFDKATTILLFAGYAVPTFWFALILIMIFSIQLGWFPLSGLMPWYAGCYSLWQSIWSIGQHLVLPVLASSLTSLAWISRYMRSHMMEVLKQDYIRTARAKGLSEARVIYRHALKNALLPLATVAGMILPALIGGSFVIEVIFGWPGMGRLGYEAMMSNDQPLMMGVFFIVTFLTLVGILISDVLNAIVDPRIRYE